MLIDDNTQLMLLGVIVLVVAGLKTALPGNWERGKALALAGLTTGLILLLFLVSQPNLPGRMDIWPIAKAFLLLLFGAGGAYSVFDVARSEMQKPDVIDE